MLADLLELFVIPVPLVLLGIRNTLSSPALMKSLRTLKAMV